MDTGKEIPSHIYLFKIGFATLVQAGSLAEDPALLPVNQKSIYLIMAIKTIHDTTDKTWFITFTCFNWIPLFQITDSYNLVYQWLNLIKEKYSIDTTAFVIMPNHVHAIIHLNASNSLNKIISNGKRFMAYEIIKRLKS